MFIVKDEHQKKQADIRIVGVGGGGNNALETMIKEGVKGVQFIAVNTDNQALEASSANLKVQIGSKITKGLGAGANPEVGRRAAVESYEEIVRSLKGADMVFVTAGMGGGTGTGAAPFVAQAAKELDLLTVGIVTKPFVFEGYKRMSQAKKGISELSQNVDTLIVVPNEKLLSLSEKDTPLLEAFKLTDDVLLQAVKGIAELVSVPGLINLDFADIKTVMRDKGMALMGRGVAKGPDRAQKAIQSAISSPLLSGVSIKGATGMIVNLTSDSSLSLMELNSASSILTQMSDPSADIIVGTVIDENMQGELSVTVIATGFEDSDDAFIQKLTDRKSEVSSPPDLAEKQDMVLENQEEKLETILENQEEKQDPGLENHQSAFVESPLKESAVNPEEELNQKPLEEESFNHSISSKEEAEKKMSVRESLLSKAKAYQENLRKKKINSDRQISMDWPNKQEELSSPFESELEFSDEDMV